MLPCSVRTTTSTSSVWVSEKRKVFRDHFFGTSLTMMLYILHRTLSDFKDMENLSDFPRNHILQSEFLIPCHLVLPPWNLKGKPLNLKIKTTQNSYYFLASFETEHILLNIWIYFYKTMHFLMHALVHLAFSTTLPLTYILKKENPSEDIYTFMTCWPKVHYLLLLHF